MTCGEVIACLSRFPPDQTVSIVVLDAGEQLFYEIGAYLLAENKSPALILEVTGAKPLKEEKGENA